LCRCHALGNTSTYFRMKFLDVAPLPSIVAKSILVAPRARNAHRPGQGIRGIIKCLKDLNLGRFRVALLSSWEQLRLLHKPMSFGDRSSSCFSSFGGHVFARLLRLRGLSLHRVLRGVVVHVGFVQEPLKHTRANTLGERYNKHNRHNVFRRRTPRRQTHIYLGYIFTGLGN
jgi:hypothetical protein